MTCFLHYLHALRATDVAVPVPAGNEDAVHILTLHQSKGLEFPVVLLPNLAHGQFPAGRHGREEIAPPGFRESDTPGERDAEERCLFYVGVTRARDIVAFSRAASYGKARTGGAVSVAGAHGWRARLEQPRTAALRRGVRAPVGHRRRIRGDERRRGDRTTARDQSEGGARAIAHAEKPVFRLPDLNQYLECPLQYKYMRIHGFRDPARDAVYASTPTSAGARRSYVIFRRPAPGADWKAAEARLQSLWDEIGPAGHAYEDFYRQAAEAILREEWRAITSPEQAAASERVRLAQPLQARPEAVHRRGDG